MSTEFITKPAKKWSGFVLTVLLYVLMDVSKIYTTWVSTVDKAKTFSDIPWQDRTAVLALMIFGVCQTIRSLMNSSYQDAKKGTSETTQVSTTVSTS